MSSLSRIKDQDGKVEGDDKVSLMNQMLVLSSRADTVIIKLMKGNIRKNSNKEMQKSIGGMGREDDKV